MLCVFQYMSGRSTLFVAAAWCVSRRLRNRVVHALHGNGPGRGDAARLDVAHTSLIRIGTWNVPHWSAARASVIAFDVAADIVAVQETHLAKLPLERAKTTSVSLGMRLLHGAAAQPVGNSEHGKVCGVGFLVKAGIALTREMPSTPPWRMLNAERRLHVASIPPRPHLPLGLLLVSLYAPLHTQETERLRFDAALAAFTHELDLQRPTLLLGDFNDTIGGREPCPLLAQLTGPGGAWVDLQQVFASHPLEPTYHSVATSRCNSGSSRIDLILASRSALPFVRHVDVLSQIRDG
jgi:exonuclease III